MPSPPALTERSNAWLMGRARELIAAIQRTTRADQSDILATLDLMLTEAHDRGDPVMVATLLRGTALARLATLGHSVEAEHLLDDMLAHARRHNLILFQADAHALRGHGLAVAGKDDAALTEIARALAIVDGIGVADNRDAGRQDQRSWAKDESMVLVDCWLVLNQLGIFEAAEEVVTRAYQAIRETAGPHEITLQLIDRVTMLLSWSLRLERVNHLDQAAEKFHTAASMALALEEPFGESLFPREPGIPAVEQVGILAAALAFADPDNAPVERLHRLGSLSTNPHEQILLSIALARSLDRQHQPEQAIAVLSATQSSLADAAVQPSMRLNLARELATLTRSRENTAADAISDYAAALEVELWSRRESQIAALNTRREHERLSAEHGAIAQQALQDPLTGLPNRRALDEYFRNLAASTAAQPLAVALVDLDGFKTVNDTHSHAEGDNVLRAIAGTLREALRGDDIVARYGGDEFIVLLPKAPASAAKQALNRAVTAIAAMPEDLSHGVTLSVGLVSFRPHENINETFLRADLAMYQAKRNGGNQVTAPLSSSDFPTAEEIAAENGGHIAGETSASTVASEEETKQAPGADPKKNLDKSLGKNPGKSDGSSP